MCRALVLGVMLAAATDKLCAAVRPAGCAVQCRGMWPGGGFGAGGRRVEGVVAGVGGQWEKVFSARMCWSQVCRRG